MDINLVKKGDPAAFRKLLGQHQQYAFRLAFRVVCNEEDARDVVQESFIKIWRNINSYNPSVKFTSWMYRIVTNTAIDHYRKNKNQITVTMEEAAGLLSGTEYQSRQADLNNKDLGRLIRLIADDLPDKQRLVFILRDLQELDSQEVQEILDMPATVVKSNLYHARKTIKEKMSRIVAYERR